jgi:putative transposase
VRGQQLPPASSQRASSTPSDPRAAGSARARSIATGSSGGGAGWGFQLDAPGHPEQNGRHERLHLTLQTEATRPAARTVLQQQARFDTFTHRYNYERPHQALDRQTPGSRYQPAARGYHGLDALEHPFHDWTAVITTCGRICWQRRKINVSQVFAGQTVGVKQVSEHVWLVITFMEYDLGYFDDETCRLEPIDNPFGSKLLPMSPEWTHLVWRPQGDRQKVESALGGVFRPGSMRLSASRDSASASL